MNVGKILIGQSEYILFHHFTGVIVWIYARIWKPIPASRLPFIIDPPKF